MVKKMHFVDFVDLPTFTAAMYFLRSVITIFICSYPFFTTSQPLTGRIPAAENENKSFGTQKIEGTFNTKRKKKVSFPKTFMTFRFPSWFVREFPSVSTFLAGLRNLPFSLPLFKCVRFHPIIPYVP